MATSILGQLLFEKKQNPVPYSPPTLAESQAASVAGNKAILPQAESLASDVNAYNQDQLLKTLRGAIPNFDEIVKSTSSDIASGLKGEIPSDVSAAVQNNAAARALAGGYSGSGMAGNLVARDLGRTSYDITQQALRSSESWLATASQYLTAPRMNVASSFVSPTQQFQADTERAANMFNYGRYREALRVQPEPWQKAVEGLLDWIATSGESIAGAYMGNIGGMMGGIGGGSGGGGGGGDTGGAGFDLGQFYTTGVSPESSYAGMPYGAEDYFGGSGEGPLFNKAYKKWKY